MKSKRKVQRIDSFEDWPGETCYWCGKRNNVCFEVDDDIWNSITGDPDIVLCPSCFDIEAQRKNIKYRFNNYVCVSWSDWNEDEI